MARTGRHDRGRDDRDDRVAPADARREPAPRPARLARAAGERDVTTGRVRPTTAATMSAAPATGQRSGGRHEAGEGGHLDPEHEDQGDRPAGPDGRVLPGALGGRRIGRQQGVGGVRQPVEVERPGEDGHRRDSEDAGEDRLAGRAERADHGTVPTSPTRAPTSGNAAPPLVAASSGRPAAGSAATAARTVPHPGPRAATYLGGGTSTHAHRQRHRAPDRRRRPRGSGRRRGSRRRTVGHEPAMVEQHQPREEVGRQGHVVQDCDDGHAVAP